MFQLPKNDESLSSLLYRVVSKQRVRSDVMWMPGFLCCHQAQSLPVNKEDDLLGLADSGVFCVFQARVCGTDTSEEDSVENAALKCTCASDQCGGCAVSHAHHLRPVVMEGPDSVTQAVEHHCRIVGDYWGECSRQK